MQLDPASSPAPPRPSLGPSQPLAALGAAAASPVRGERCQHRRREPPGLPFFPPSSRGEREGDSSTEISVGIVRDGGPLRG